MARYISKNRGRFRLGFVIAFCASAMLVGCDSDEHAPKQALSSTSEADPRVTTVNGSTVITVDADDQQRIGLRTAGLSEASGTTSDRAFATVVDIGPLVDLRNSFLSTRAQLISAQAKATASRAAFERAQSLYKDAQNSSLAQLEAARATYQGDDAAMIAARAQVATIVANAQLQFGPVLSRLQSGQTASLIDRRSVLIEITLPAGSSANPPPPSIVVQPDPRTSVPATFVSPTARSDPRIQGKGYYYRAAAGTLVPGMNVVAMLPSQRSQRGRVVPSDAIVIWQGQNWVYQQIGARSFRRIPVDTSVAVSGGYLDPFLPSGARLVTTGAQLLLSEELRPRSQVSGGDDD